MTTIARRLLAATAATTLGFLALTSVTAGAQTAPTTAQPEAVAASCIVVTFTEPGPQILRSRSVPVACDDYAALEGATAAAVATACVGVPVQGDLAPNVTPWSDWPLNTAFPENVPGALAAITDIVGTSTSQAMGCAGLPMPAPPTVSTLAADETPVAVPTTLAAALAAPAPEVPATVALPVAEDAEATSSTVAADGLPVTGANTGPLVLALVLLAAGAAFAAASMILKRPAAAQ